MLVLLVNMETSVADEFESMKLTVLLNKFQYFLILSFYD